jgi:protein subunit release factor B
MVIKIQQNEHRAWESRTYHQKIISLTHKITKFKKDATQPTKRKKKKLTQCVSFH